LLEEVGQKARRMKKKADDANMSDEEDMEMMDDMGEKRRPVPGSRPPSRPPSRPGGGFNDGGDRPLPPPRKNQDYLDLMDLLEEVGQKARRMKKKTDNANMSDEEDASDDEFNKEGTSNTPFLDGFLGTSELQAMLEHTKPQSRKKEKKSTSATPKVQLKRETATAEKEPTSNPEELEEIDNLRPIPPDPEIEKMMQEVFGTEAINKNRAKKKLKIRGVKNASKAHDLATVVSMVEEAIHEALEELNILYSDNEWSNSEMVDEQEAIQFIMESLGRKGYEEYEEEEEEEIDYDIYVYPEFAIVEFPRASYRVPYAIEQGDVAIGMPSEWTRVTETWKDIPNAPTFAEAVSQDQEDAIKTIINRWSDETLEYQWVDEEVVAEMKSVGEAIKMLEDGTVIAQAVRFGSPSETDISEFRDYFTKSTNFWLTEWQTRPMLYDHATDSQTRDNPVVGKWIKAWTDETGVWLKGQLNKAHKYAEAIKELAKMGLLKLSTDSAPHLVIRARNENGTHEIKRWPIVAASLTVQPAEPRLPAIEVKNTNTRKKAEVKPDTKPITSLDTPSLLQLVEDIQKLGEVE
jgi:predicted transcriptional regulator